MPYVLCLTPHLAARLRRMSLAGRSSGVSIFVLLYQYLYFCTSTSEAGKPSTWQSARLSWRRVWSECQCVVFSLFSFFRLFFLFLLLFLLVVVLVASRLRPRTRALRRWCCCCSALRHAVCGCVEHIVRSYCYLCI
jgi:hypothetical protein